MTEVTRIMPIERIQEMVDERIRSTLKGDGGGGTSDEMEERLARLEKIVEKLADSQTEIRVDIATIKENIRHLPTKPWIFTTLAAMTTSLLVLMTFMVGLIVRFMPHAG